MDYFPSNTYRLVIRLLTVAIRNLSLVLLGPAQLEVESATTTFIEAYFFQGRICEPFQYHIAELLRLVVLPMSEITAFGDVDTAGAYAKRIAQKIWSCGGPALKYHCLYPGGGRAMYGCVQFGGTFRFGDWHRKLYQYCNCYDLAGIVQLACKALGMRPTGGQDVPVRYLFFSQRGHLVNSI
jgi:hypothetical protein